MKEITESTIKYLQIVSFWVYVSNWSNTTTKETKA